MYALSTTTYVGFQAVMTEEMSEKFRGLPGVVFILPDSYLYPETKEYGGDKYENGVITPRPPPVHYSKPSRTDRNSNYRGNYENSPPPQGNYQNSPPPLGNYQNSPPPQGNSQMYCPQQDGRGYSQQQNYAQAGQDGRGYGRNDSADCSGCNGAGGYQGHVNQAGQVYQNSQERMNFLQGEAGDFRPGGPLAPGTYGSESKQPEQGEASPLLRESDAQLYEQGPCDGFPLHTISARCLYINKTISSGFGPLSHNRQGVRTSVFSRKLSGIADQGEESTYKLYESESRQPEQGEHLKPSLDEFQTMHKKPCPIATGNSELLLKKIKDALLEINRKLDKDLLKQKFHKKFRPHLVSRCLVLPEDIHSQSTEFLHNQHHLVNRRTPQYLSSYELMLQREIIVDDDEWDCFWNYLIRNKVFIVEDWESNICNVETIHYDYGIKGFCKGEVDASFHDGEDGEPGKATISCIIWKDDKVICAEVYRDMVCSSIHGAEAYAVLALFFKCFEMGIEDLVLWNDNSDIHGSITGSYTVRHGNEDRDVLLLLGCMSTRFNKLIPMCKPRELLFLPDYLAQNSVSISKSIGTVTVEDLALKKFAYHLSGKAMFKLSLAGPARQIVKEFRVKKYMRKHQTKCFMEVDNLNKLNALAEIKETLCPSQIFLAIHHLEEKPEDFHSQVKEMAGPNLDQSIVKDDYTVLNFCTENNVGKRLLVVLDATLPKDIYDYLGCFTIILVSPGERQSLDPGIEELSALSYVYFNGVREGEKDRKGSERRKKR